MEIETDSSKALQLLHYALPPYEFIILVCRSLLKRLQNPLGNYVADVLSKQGSMLTTYDKAIILQSPPKYIKDLLAKDKN
ncbi:hypothetical protein H5410_057697 [Solanum commersonii]|uniref:Uncharacterized protein n=1 Tax=Solanum commersonii TaxID=4109 RepID=A0A9J5WNL3_SOLCO|nr:hypothetical protein H5410_057697 [Solanum commersonii]